LVELALAVGTGSILANSAMIIKTADKRFIENLLSSVEDSSVVSSILMPLLGGCENAEEQSIYYLFTILWQIELALAPAPVI